jgi:hypothetical protein
MNIVLSFGIFFCLLIGLNSPDDINTLLLPKGVNAEYITWNKKSKTITFLKSVNFSVAADEDYDLERFYWEVPNVVDKIIIDPNVTIKGGFRTSKSISISGKNRKTSIIYGTITKNWALGPDGKAHPESSCNDGPKGDDRVDDCHKWQYGAVSYLGKDTNAVITVNNLTIHNARTYAITTFSAKVDINNVHIKFDRPYPDFQSNSDGVSAGKGSIIKNSKFECWDDAIKLYRDITVENVTIIHNGNGAPFQLGWGSKPNKSYHKLKNILVISSPEKKRHLALFSASTKNGSLNTNVEIDGLKANYPDSLMLKSDSRLPLFLLKSPDVLLSVKAKNIHMTAPIGHSGPGKLNLSICNNSAIINTYQCGKTKKITGCGW